MKNEVIEALLETEDEDETEAVLAKELSGPTEDFLERQKSELLQTAISAKEAYLGRKCVKTEEFTNPMGETFVFGSFGVRNKVLSTLMYLDKQTGWKLVEGLEDDDEEDFKEVYGEPEEKKYLPLGSYSHGTMQPEHLIPRFLRALEQVNPDQAAALKLEYDALPEDADFEDFCWETLVTELEPFAPPYTYFGSNEGDGADYGVWISRDSIDDELRYNDNSDLIGVKAGNPLPLNQAEYIVVYDRAGEYTRLLDGTTGKEIWSNE